MKIVSHLTVLLKNELKITSTNLDRSIKSFTNPILYKLQITKSMSKASFDSFLILALKKHYWIALATFISVIGASAVYLAVTPSRYKTSAKLIVGEQEISVSDLEQQLAEKNIISPSKSADPVATQAELVETQKVLQRALKNFQQDTKIPDEDLPNIRDFKKAIDVEILPATNILRLVYRDSDPKIAAELLNSVAQSVVEENIETKRLQASTLRTFLEAKIAEQQVKLQQAELAETEYRQAQGQVNLEEQTKSLVNSLSELENEERSLLAQLRATTIQDDLLSQATGVDNFDQASQAIRIAKDEELQKLQNQLKELEEVIANRRSYLTDKAPELQTLLEERDNLRASLEQKLSSTFPAERTFVSNSTDNATSNPYDLDLISKYVSGQIENKALESRLETVRAELNDLRSRVAQIPVYQKPLAELVRRREKTEASLELLQTKLEEARIAESRPTSTTRIVDLAAINTIPVFPKTGAVLVISTTAGIFLAIASVLLLEMLNRRLDDSLEAEATFSLPTLGVLPKLPSAVVDDSSYLEKFLDNPVLVEPYRALLKTLESSSNKTNPFAERKTPTIVFSSVVPGEEKSSAILHLAAVAAMLSRRTLIIDADWHQPMQHQLLDVPSYPGLTEVLKDPSNFMSVVQSTKIKNLSVLTYGRFNSRPAEAIESESMKVLLEKSANYYDLVIVDASPASICADASTLSKVTDGIALVVRPNFISKKIILNAISKIKQSDASLLGVVINEAADRQDTITYLNGKNKQDKTTYLNGKKDNFAKAFNNTLGSLDNLL